MRGALRLFVAAFLTDASLYLAFAALPFRAIELGAGPAHLGILPTLYAVAYMVIATFGGWLSDRVPRLRLASAGCIVFLLGCIGLAAAPGLGVLMLVLPVLGLGLGFFWSPVQASISDRVGPNGLSRAVGTFNVCWSLGKGTGLVVGGVLTDALSPRPALLAAAVPVLLTILILPRSRTVGRARRTPERDEPAPIDADRTFLGLAWMTNAIAFGVGSLMNVHAPKLLLERGGGASEFGIVLGTVFAVQTLTFAVVSRSRPLRSTLLLAHAAGAGALALFVTAPGFGVRLLSAVPLGVALALAYQSSIHASLDRAHSRGRAAGNHESLLAAGSSSIPLLGGLTAAASGSLAAPFAVGAGLLGAGLLVTVVLGRRRPGTASSEGSPPRAP